MKIKTILSQHRRDFYATYECEHCNHVTEKQSGYDDENFHNNVIPLLKCPKCDKTADEKYRPLQTKYHEDEVI